MTGRPPWMAGGEPPPSPPRRSRLRARGHAALRAAPLVRGDHARLGARPPRAGPRLGRRRGGRRAGAQGARPGRAARGRMVAGGDAGRRLPGQPAHGPAPRALPADPARGAVGTAPGPAGLHRLGAGRRAARLVRQRLAGGARRVLRSAGLEVTRAGGGGGPRRTLPQVLGHLRERGVAPATVIDVGVAAGTPELYEAFPGVPLLLVEPLAEHEGHLREIVAARPGSSYALAAGGPEPGELEIAVHRVLACSSVLGDRDPGGEPAQRRAVPVVRLDDLVAERGLNAPFVVRVDVEGAELQVLAGARATLAQAQAVLLEVSFFQLVGGGAEVADVIAWMRDAGFSPYDIYHGHLRPLDGALAQVDMAFVPTDGPLRADHRYATPEQADALYRRWGL